MTTDIHPKLTKQQDELENEWVKNMRRTTQPHIDSYNHAISHDIHRMIQQLPTWKIVEKPTEESEETETKTMELNIVGVNISKPEMPESNGAKLYPSQCREGRLDYSGKLTLEFEVSTYQGEDSSSSHSYRISVDAGFVPIMVMSSLCHLRHMTKEQLAKHGEELFEAGGYFITGGSEKVVRLLNAPKRNYVCCCCCC